MTMEINKTYKQIQLIYFVVVVVLASLAAFTFYYVHVMGKVGGYDIGVENNLKSLNILLALVGIPASYMFHKRKVNHIEKTLPVNKKLIQFRTAFFVKIATLEGLALISVMIYLLTGEINQLMVFGLLYLFLLLNFPSTKTINRDLEINDNDF